MNTKTEHELQSDVIDAVVNFANACDDGSLNDQIIRALVEAWDAAR